MSPTKNLPVVFYATAAGNEPVREWLKALSPKDRSLVGHDLLLVELGWPETGMPLVKPLGRGLFEVRSNISNGIARVFFCVDDGCLLCLHAVVKKSHSVPADIALARRRMKE